MFSQCFITLYKTALHQLVSLLPTVIHSQLSFTITQLYTLFAAHSTPRKPYFYHYYLTKMKVLFFLTAAALAMASVEAVALPNPEAYNVAHFARRPGQGGKAKRDAEADPYQVVHFARRPGQGGKVKREAEPEPEPVPEPYRWFARRPGQGGKVKRDAEAEPEPEPEPYVVLHGVRRIGQGGKVKREVEDNTEDVALNENADFETPTTVQLEGLEEI